MKICDVINPYKAMVEQEILEETRLSSAFSIGFELEAICDSDVPELRDRGSLPSYHTRGRESGGSLYLKNLLNKLLDMGDGKINSLGNGEVASITSDKEVIWNKPLPGDWYIDGSDNSLYCNNCSYESDLGINVESEGINPEEPLKIGTFNDRENEFSYTSIGNELAKKFTVLKNLSINKSKIESDGSVYPDVGTDTTGHAWSFEWASPVIKFNPKNIEKIYKFLTSLKDYGIYTNNSCGFHTHISFEDINKDDAKWILFCIANDDNLLDQVSYLRVPGEEPINFFGERYASDEWFRNLKAHGNLKNWSFNASTSTKYLQMRVHPGAGTIEWRGPRNFINKGENTQLIKEYLLKLWKLILEIAKIVDLKEYNGYKRSDVLEKFRLTGNFDTTSSKIADMSLSTLTSMLKDKPAILVSIKPSKLKMLLEKNANTVLSALRHGKIWSKLTKINKETIIKYFYSTNDMATYIENLVLNGNIDSITTEILINEGRNHEEQLINILKEYVNGIQITNGKVMETLVNMDIPTNILIKIFVRFPNFVTLKVLQDIANSNQRYMLSRLPELPLKIQRVLIRKNPYNIQYINNPDQSIINELKKKYGDELNDYILGVA